jgi:membrane-bound lytic murein transglycosylase B
MSSFKPAPADFSLKCLLPVVFFVFIGLIPLEGWADWSPLMDRLIRDGKDEKIVTALFTHPEARFDPDPMTRKLQELIRNLTRKPPSPEAAERIKAIYRGFLRPEVIGRAHAFRNEHRATLKRIRNQYCVPEEVVVAILLVETELGQNTGSRRAFTTLASMALAGDLDMIRPYLAEDFLTPSNEAYARRRCREKSDWAYQELKALIRYAHNNGLDPLEIPGSIYGAIGLCQFMPSNVPAYGVDADGDGRIDLFATEDALHSIGKYLSQHGWKCRMSRSGQHRVVMTYNRSRTYANTVLAVAEQLRIKARGESLRARQEDRG